MKVLAIDIGWRNSNTSIFYSDTIKEDYFFQDIVIGDGSCDFIEYLNKIKKVLPKILKEKEPDYVVIEKNMFKPELQKDPYNSERMIIGRVTQYLMQALGAICMLVTEHSNAKIEMIHPCTINKAVCSKAILTRIPRKDEMKSYFKQKFGEIEVSQDIMDAYCLCDTFILLMNDISRRNFKCDKHELQSEFHKIGHKTYRVIKKQKYEVKNEYNKTKKRKSWTSKETYNRTKK